MPQNVPRLARRQVHLDFHTSPWIPDVGAEFDAKTFAATLKRAHVDSVTVFAKCHHGQCYFPTTTGTSHPALKGRDLLGEQIEALHAVGIRCPIYTTVVWEEDVALKHPEWRQMTKSGHFAGWTTAADGSSGQPGNWKFNNFLDPDYQDYIEAHLREICRRYGREVDGFFLDILFFDALACWSEPSIKFRAKHRLLGEDRATFDIFQAKAQGAFAKKFTRIIRGLRPKATIFYNSGNDGNMMPGIGPRAREAHMSHFEIESLPSGFWGYHHFPRLARMQSRWGKDWLGMTGRFQKMWGDFGGIKPLPALEYECFRSQALGGGNSVGDQLPPRGAPDPAAYELIGAVYKQCADAEPFYEGSTPLAQVGLFSASWPGHDGGKSEEGAVQLCDEMHYDSAVLDGRSDIRGLELLILPDATVVTPQLKTKLRRFYKAGGKLLLSHRAGFDASGRWALDFLPLSFAGEVEKYPTYWRARAAFDRAMSASDRVFYQPGMQAKGGRATTVLVDRVLPYFKRSDVKLCSHFQTPPVARPDRYPAVIAGERFVYFADPIFREYRQSGNMAARSVWQKCMSRLVGPAPMGSDLPSTVLSVPRRRGKDLLITLLHYIPIRKALDIDIINERSAFGGEVLRIRNAKRVVRFESDEELPSPRPGEFILPQSKGRLLLIVPDYFANARP